MPATSSVRACRPHHSVPATSSAHARHVHVHVIHDIVYHRFSSRLNALNMIHLALATGPSRAPRWRTSGTPPPRCSRTPRHGAQGCIIPRLKSSVYFLCLKLKYDQPLSNVSFNVGFNGFNLRPCTTAFLDSLLTYDKENIPEAVGLTSYFLHRPHYISAQLKPCCVHPWVLSSYSSPTLSKVSSGCAQVAQVER